MITFLLHKRIKAIRWIASLFIAWLFALTANAQIGIMKVDHLEQIMFDFTDRVQQTNDSISPSDKAITSLKNAGWQRSLNCISTLYIRQNMTTHRRGFIMRYIPDMFQLEKGYHNYLSEVQMRVQHRAPGTTDCKVVAYHTNARYQSADRFLNMGRFCFTIYGEKLFINHVLSPLHRRNRRFYRYSYMFSLPATITQPATHCIRVTPRFSNEQLTSGTIYINQQTGAVVSFKLKFSHQFQTYSVNARMGLKGYAMYVPQRMRIVSDFKLLGNKVHEVYDILAHHTFSHIKPTTSKRSARLDFTPFCQMRLDTTQIITSNAYFDSIRPFPLRHIEVMQHHPSSGNVWAEDSLPPLPNDTLSKWKYVEDNKRTSSMRTQDILLSSHAFNLTNNGTTRIKLPPIFTPSMVQWSGTRGLSLNMKLALSYTPKAKDQKTEDLFTFKPMIGYSFKQKQVYWETPMTLNILPKVNGKLSFTAGGGSHSYNNEQAEELSLKLKDIENYDSLLNIINHYGFHDYRDNYANLDLAVSPYTGLTLTLGSRYHRRTLIAWNDVAQAAGFIHRLTTIGPSVQLQWTPAQYFYRDGARRMPLFSHYPTFLLKYERGFALGSGQTSYERIESDVRYRLPLYALRTLYFRMGCGMFTRRRKQCFLDYDYFRFYYMPQGWNDDLTGEFQLLNPRFYNESRYYLRLTTTYESPMLMLSRLPHLARIIQRERLYLNLLSVRSLAFYAETGYGISTHLIDLGMFTSFAPDRSCHFGFKVVFKLLDEQ